MSSPASRAGAVFPTLSKLLSKQLDVETFCRHAGSADVGDVRKWIGADRCRLRSALTVFTLCTSSHWFGDNGNDIVFRTVRNNSGADVSA
ncbi:protein of unknown function [Paraburkholderia kururiensis]